MFKKAKTLIAAFVILSFLGGAVPARALDRDDDRKCEQQIRNAERKLHDAERKHGEHSRQAQSRRRDLEKRGHGAIIGTAIMTMITTQLAKERGLQESLLRFTARLLPPGLFFFCGLFPRTAILIDSLHGKKGPSGYSRAGGRNGGAQAHAQPSQ